MRRLDLADYLLIAEAILGITTDRLKRTAKLGLVESALAAPFAGFGDHDLYPEPAGKAAVLCSRLIRNHPLPDGNKRVAFICMREFIARNGLTWRRPPDDEAAAMVERLAGREIDEADFGAWLTSYMS
ncbi:MAG TPA: Fic family protein [Thermoleophilaceae bacterium]|nr:Fic family protein [Thermoleophilaceae bacterium]